MGVSVELRVSGLNSTNARQWCHPGFVYVDLMREIIVNNLVNTVSNEIYICIYIYIPKSWNVKEKKMFREVEALLIEIDARNEEGI